MIKFSGTTFDNNSILTLQEHLSSIYLHEKFKLDIYSDTQNIVEHRSTFWIFSKLIYIGCKMNSITKSLTSLYDSIIYKKTEKVFCISMQRNGTSSVGKFFRDFGFRWAGWPADLKNNWSTLWYNGDFEKIFSSEDFKKANAFEDSPWFFPDFYKVLYNRYPNSKFILFTRNPDVWFNSMINHSGGDIIGRGRIHCKIYRRELEYFDLLNDGLIDEKVENQIHTMKTMKLTNLSAYYKKQYRLYNYEVIDFFQRKDPKVLHIGNLEDKEKWVKLGAFLKIDVPDNYRSHENNSIK